MRQLKITKSITNRESTSFDKYLLDIKHISLISPEEEIELARQIRSGSQSAKNKLIKSNLRFVVSVAKQYTGFGVPLEDLIQEGNLGLIKAAEKFDETRGFKFISYAVWWIRQSILQTINDNQIRIPTNQFQIHRQIIQLVNEFEQLEMRKPTIEEISSILDIPINKIPEISKVISLSTPISNDESEVTYEDILGNEDKETSESLKIDLSRCLNKTLSSRQLDIISRLFGLDKSEQTLETVSDELNLSHERTRQIREEAIWLLRRNKNAFNLLRSYL